MSYPVTLTSNKAEFQNYLSDQIKIAKNSEVCLTKTAMSIPIKVISLLLYPPLKLPIMRTTYLLLQLMV